jgi:hypothetical protein
MALGEEEIRVVLKKKCMAKRKSRSRWKEKHGRNEEEGEDREDDRKSKNGDYSHQKVGVI